MGDICDAQKDKGKHISYVTVQQNSRLKVATTFIRVSQIWMTAGLTAVQFGS